MTTSEPIERGDEEAARSEPSAHGKLRVYLGAAPGVGKSYAMLNQAHRRLERGTGVVVGLVETHGRPKTAAVVDGLEVLPQRQIAASRWVSSISTPCSPTVPRSSSWTNWRTPTCPAAATKALAGRRGPVRRRRRAADGQRAAPGVAQ